jgi:hypothetical protein
MSIQEYKNTIGARAYNETRDSANVVSLYHHRDKPTFRLMICGRMSHLWNSDTLIINIVEDKVDLYHLGFKCIGDGTPITYPLLYHETKKYSHTLEEILSMCEGLPENNVIGCHRDGIEFICEYVLSNQEYKAKSYLEPLGPIVELVRCIEQMFSDYKEISGWVPKQKKTRKRISKK